MRKILLTSLTLALVTLGYVQVGHAEGSDMDTNTTASEGMNPNTGAPDSMPHNKGVAN